MFYNKLQEILLLTPQFLLNIVQIFVAHFHYFSETTFHQLFFHFFIAF